MIAAHAQSQYSAATATPPWEVETGASVINNDNGWLLSFIDILALLLTLFVLLLAYEADGPDAGNTKSPVLQPQVVQPDITPPSVDHASQEPSQVPAPFPVFDSLGLPVEDSLPQVRRAAPGVIDLPIAVAVEYRRALPASETASPEAAQTASAGRIDVPTEVQVEAPLDVSPTVGSAGNAATPAPEPVLASQPLPEISPANVSAVGLQGAPVSTPNAIASVSPQDALLAALASSGLQERVEVTLHSGGVNLEVSDSILFMPASAALTTDGSGLLGELAATLAEHPLRLSVEGHTDNIPIQTNRYPSNWELSSARAAAVTRQLIERGVAADRIRAIGYGDTRPRADNDTPEGRARNRRVSFVLQIPSETPAGAAD